MEYDATQVWGIPELKDQDASLPSSPHANVHPEVIHHQGLQCPFLYPQHVKNERPICKKPSYCKAISLTSSHLGTSLPKSKLCN